ncbi:NAD(P)/FAD-dependent oxidoreductase [Ideonella sp. LYT19W]|uniref:NAD(P)/FAD-dependent oxidoreductase n=2 Tax=Ideonella margarita TaxID=2984191 RepID=A0ABU9C5Q7_9BURK
MTTPDVMVIGAGAAGLFCAAQAGQLGLKVVLIDHAPKLAEKIRISGGGRCNFTNREATPANYVSENPHFARSALARYPSSEFIALVQRYGIAFHEKHKGQLFCDDSAEQIIRMLLTECERGGVERWQPCSVSDVQSDEAGGWRLQTDRGVVHTPQLVIATGGLPVPKIGATDFGLKLAERLGHRLVAPRTALVPLTFAANDWAPFVPMAGIAMPVCISTRTPTGGKGKKAFVETQFFEDLLFTHRGLSGPAVLQISSFWRPGHAITIDLLPGTDVLEHLLKAKQQSRRHLGNELAGLLTQRLADAWLQMLGVDGTQAMPQVPDAQLRRIAESLQAWSLTPAGTEGWNKAEVMAGGVDTRDLSSQTMASKHHPSLYFIGEVVDVTGWLGGYNFQWAWASAVACAQALKQSQQDTLSKP